MKITQKTDGGENYKMKKISQGEMTLWEISRDDRERKREINRDTNKYTQTYMQKI